MELIYNGFLVIIASIVHQTYSQNESLVATSSAQYLSSPGYPTEYPNDLVYDWLITSAVDTELVKIEVPDCEIEYLAGKIPACQVDKLEIYDGEFDNATVLYQSCCLTSVPSMNSSGQHLLIRFTTDSTVGSKGFQIKYYNTAFVSSDVAAAGLGMYIAIALVAVTIVIIVIAAVTFYIHKKKKSRDHRVNPVGGEEKASTSKGKYQDPEIDEYKKRPLPADSPSPVPAPHAWSMQDGMEAPKSTGPKPDLLIDQNLPDGTVRGNKLPPINMVKSS